MPIYALDSGVSALATAFGTDMGNARRDIRAALPFASRDLAIATVIPEAVQQINIAGLDFIADPAGAALETAGGRRWSPLGTPTPEHYGSLDDDAANTAAITAALASGRYIELPVDLTTTYANFRSVPAGGALLSHQGRKLFDASGNVIPPFYRHLNAAPVGAGATNDGGLLAGFNYSGDATPFRRGLLIAGAATIGQPDTGYQFNHGASLTHDIVRFESGHQQSPTSGDGRTGWVMHRQSIEHRGEGDAIAFNPNIQVWGRDGTATNMLSQPAGAVYGGTLRARADRVGLTLGEFKIEDNGFDVRGVGRHLILTRTNDTESNENFWEGLRFNSNGTRPVNVGLHLVGVNGGYKYGLTTTGTTITTGGAVVMKAGQFVEFHGIENPSPGGILREPTAMNGWSIGYEDGATPGVLFKAGGARIARVASDHFSVGRDVDDAQALRVRGASASVRATLGVVGNNAFISAFSNIDEASSLYLRAADATGTEQNTVVIGGASPQVNLPRTGSRVAIGGVNVLGAQRPAIPDATAGTEITTINAILAALRAHGLIAT